MSHRLGFAGLDHGKSEGLSQLIGFQDLAFLAGSWNGDPPILGKVGLE